MTPLTRPSRPRTRLRKLGIAIAVVLGALALGELAGWPFLRAPLQQLLEKRSAATVALEGRFRAHLFINPGIAVERATIGPLASVDVPYLFRAEGLVLKWRWVDLWRARDGSTLRFKSLQADLIDAHLVRLSNGDMSWAADRSESGGKMKYAEPPQFEHLLLHSGEVVYRDEPLDIDLTIHISQSIEPDTPLPWRAQASGRYHGAKVELSAQAGAGLPLLAYAQIEPAVTPLQLSGQVGSTTLEFDGTTSALWVGPGGMRGNFSLRGASLRTSGRPLGLTLPDTPPYQLHGEIAGDGKVWSLQTDDITVGSSALTAAMEFDTSTQPPSLRGHVGGRRLAFADLGPAIGADQPRSDTGRVLPDEQFDLPSLQAMNADVQVDLAQLDFGTPKLAPITDLKVHLQLVRSRLTLMDLNAQVAGGVLTGSTRLLADQSPPAWEAVLRFAEIDLKQWIRALDKDADAASVDAPAYLGGTLSAEAIVSGVGSSVAEFLGSADGKLSIEVTDGQLSQLVTETLGLDAAQALGMLIAGDQSLRLNCARAEAVIRDGVVKTRHAVLDNEDSTVYLQGGASLKSEELHLRIIAEPKDFSPFSLRSPLNVTGSFKQPEVSVEASGLLARAVGALVLGALAPPAALLAFIDTGTEPDTEPCVPLDRSVQKVE